MSAYLSPVCSLLGVAARRPAAAWQRLGVEVRRRSGQTPGEAEVSAPSVEVKKKALQSKTCTPGPRDTEAMPVQKRCVQ